MWISCLPVDYQSISIEAQPCDTGSRLIELIQARVPPLSDVVQDQITLWKVSASNSRIQEIYK